MHLVLEVDTEKSVESTIERMTYELRSLLKKENIRYIGIHTPKYRSKYVVTTIS